MIAAKLRSLWRSLSRRSDVEQRMSDELQFHLDARAEDLAARYGLSPGEAARRARIEFGSTEKFKEQGRESLGLRLIDELRADLRFALRTFARNKAFAATAIATLAIGIGANTAVFSVADAVLIKRLPVRNPHELVMFDWLRTDDAMVAAYSGYGRPASVPGVGVRTSFSLLTYERIRDHTRTLASVCAFTSLGDVSVVANGPAEAAAGQVVTGTYHATLGVGTTLGRSLSTSDDRLGAEPVAVISHRYWQRRFDADPRIVGRTVSVNRVPLTVVGVTEAGFDGTLVGRSVDITMPLALAAALNGGVARPVFVWWLEIMGRLAPGTTPDQATAELRGIFADSVRDSWAAKPPTTPNPSRNRVPELRVLDGSRGTERTRRDAGPLLAILFAIVTSILLIACVNVANLLLVRASARGHEVALRLVLGAGRARIARQMLTESVVLALCGGALGVVVARWVKDLTAWIVLGAPEDASRLSASIDPRVIAFAALLSVATALAFGIGPALRATRRDVEFVRWLGSKGATPRSAGRKLLVAVQVALCLVLLIGAGLFARTVYNFNAVDVGFDADNLLVFRVAGRDVAQYEELVARIEAVPGVKAATLSGVPLVARNSWTDAVAADGNSRPADASVQSVRSNFFDTVGLPLLSGRGLMPGDGEGAPRVAVVNQTMAQRVFGSANPIGRRFWFVEGPNRNLPIEVVGVARDAKYSSLQEPAPPTFYLPYTQMPPGPMVFEVRTATDPLLLVPAVREAARAVDPELPLIGVRTQREQIARTFRTERSVAAVASVFSTIALLLASIGLFGIAAYDVRRRTTEIGVRMALGARRGDVLRLVLRETIVMVAAGALAGLMLAFTARRLIARMLFGVEASDPLTMIGAVAVLMAVAVAAIYVPARRAVRLDPSRALRYE